MSDRYEPFRVDEESFDPSRSMDKPDRLSVFEGSRSEFFSRQGTQDGEQMGEHTPVERLLRALQDEDWHVRKEAEKVLVHRAEQGHLEPLLKALPDQDVFVRATMVRALGKAGASAPVELLVSVFKEEHQQVRAAAATALGQLGERVPIEPLVAALQDEDRQVRAAAATALGQLGERAPVESLVAALQDEDGQVRVAAATALGQLGEHAPVESLVAALQNKHGQVRQIAATALGQFGAYTPVEPLVAALGDSEEGVRDAAAQTLQQTHPDALLEVATEAIAILQGQGSGTVLGSIAQGFIADTIGQLEQASPVLLAKLAHLLDWPHWEVRMKAAQALGKLRRNIPDVAIRRLLELRHDPQSRVVRLAANDALAEILSLETGIEDD